MVRRRSFFAGGSWGAGLNPGVATSSFFFLSSFFLPFCFLLFIFTADPVSFARFLRKRISSLFYCLFARDVTAAMLVVKNKSISFLWELNYRDD